MYLSLGLIFLLLWSHFDPFLAPAVMSFYALKILRIELGFTGRFTYAGELQILLPKSSLKQVSEEGHIMTGQTLGRTNSGPVRLPVQ